VCMLIKCHHLDGVNWPTTLWKQRCRVHFLNKGHLLCTEDDNSCYRNVCKMSKVT